MRDWIVGLEKAATSRKPGIGDFDWGEVGNELQRDVPDELRDLYKTMDGATFSTGIKLHPLRRGLGASTTVVSSSKDHAHYWSFGEKADGSPLFAVLRAELEEAVPEAQPPDWVSSLPEGQWVYGATKDGAIKLYRSLEQLLGALIPPAQHEEFGDVTYARAMSAVHHALSGLNDGEVTQVPLSRSGKKKTAARKAPTKAKKAAARKARPARRAQGKAKKKAPARPARKGTTKVKVAGRKSAKSARKTAGKKRR